MSRQPPIVATLLLERAVTGSEPIVGDLVEEFANGRGRRWYWKQVMVALAAGLRDEILDNKLMTLRAIVTGWTVLAFFSLLLWELSLDLVGGLMPIQWHVFLWTHPPGIQVLLAALGGVVYLLSGWLVARLHRRHRVAMLLVYIASLSLWRFPGLSNLIVTHHRPHYLYSLVISVLVLLVNVAFIVIGGSLAGTGNRPTRPEIRSTAEPSFVNRRNHADPQTKRDPGHQFV